MRTYDFHTHFSFFSIYGHSLRKPHLESACHAERYFMILLTSPFYHSALILSILFRNSWILKHNFINYFEHKFVLFASTAMLNFIHNPDYFLLLINQVRMGRGYNSKKIFEDQIKLLPKDLKRRIKYFRIYLKTNRIHLYPIYSKTDRDGERWAKPSL